MYSAPARTILILASTRVAAYKPQSLPPRLLRVHRPICALRALADASPANPRIILKTGIKSIALPHAKCYNLRNKKHTLANWPSPRASVTRSSRGTARVFGRPEAKREPFTSARPDPALGHVSGFRSERIGGYDNESSSLTSPRSVCYRIHPRAVRLFHPDRHRHRLVPNSIASGSHYRLRQPKSHPPPKHSAPVAAGNSAIRGYVFQDVRLNGLWAKGSPGVAATLNLEDSALTLRRTVASRASDGYYQFTGLRPGNYPVHDFPTQSRHLQH